MSGTDVSAGSWQTLQLRTKVDHNSTPLFTLAPSDMFNIVAMTRGACRMESRGEDGWRAASFAAGDVGITVPGRAVLLRWQLLARQPKETVHIDLPMAVFERYLVEEDAPRVSDLRRLDVLSTADAVITAMAAALVRARAAGAGELYAETAAQYLVAHLLTPRVLHEPAEGVLGERQLDLVVQFMHAHLADRIRLDDLAKQLVLSRFHFVRLFTATTGCSPFRYLTGLRLDAACRALRASDDPVAQVGRRCGFPNPSHFAATFTRHVGCTPREYRQRSRA